MRGCMKLKPHQQYEQRNAGKAQGENPSLIPNTQSSKQCGQKREEHIHSRILAYVHTIKMVHCLGK
jgi:hypothetical protein